MADYIYRISATGIATGANAGFVDVNSAVADFKANNRMAAGVGIVAASSTLYFRIDGFLALSAADIYGIDTTTNAGAAVIVDAWANPWNVTDHALGYTAAFDGLNLGTSAALNIGQLATRAYNHTVRNLMLTNALSTYGVIQAYGATTGTNPVQINNCFLRNTAATTPVGVLLDAAALTNCVLYLPNATTIGAIANYGRINANTVDDCTIIVLAGTSTLVNDQNDPNPVFRNTYIGGCTVPTSYGSLSSLCVGNATDATTLSGTTGTLTSVALSTANFLNITNGTEDFRAQSASVLKTTGAARLASVLTDVFGRSRYATTTIGAYEVISGGGGRFFRVNPALAGLGNSGPFFSNPLN